MVLAICLGAFVGWLFPALISARYRRWWVASLTVFGTSALLFFLSVALATFERQLADTSVDRPGTVVVWMLISGTVTCVWSVVRAYRPRDKKPSHNDTFGYK